MNRKRRQENEQDYYPVDYQELEDMVPQRRQPRNNQQRRRKPTTQHNRFRNTKKKQKKGKKKLLLGNIDLYLFWLACVIGIPILSYYVGMSAFILLIFVPIVSNVLNNNNI